VLFGGATTLAGDVQLGDTWEAPGDSAATPGGVALTSLDLRPQGTAVYGNLQLSGPAPPGGVLVRVTTSALTSQLADSSFQVNIPGPPWSIPIPAGRVTTGFSLRTGLLTGAVLPFTATLGTVTLNGSVTLP
jgi:hypothetical protein